MRRPHRGRVGALLARWPHRGRVGALVLAALAVAFPAAAREAAPGTGASPSLEEHVRYLASEELGGRLSGSEGERRAADYLVAQLERLGAKPLPGAQGLRVPFEFSAGTRDAGSSLRLVAPGRDLRWEAPADVRALSFSSGARVTGPVVFAGYGLDVPETLGVAYDSYAGLDVEDRVVVVLRYFPEDAEPELRTTLSRYSGLRYKALAARERGARALLVITGPRSPHAGELVPMTFDTAVSGSGIAAVSASGAVAEALFAGLPQGSLEEVQKRLDDGNPHVTGFPIPGVEFTVEARIERERRTAVNVVGVLPAAEGGSAPADPPKAVMVGAHFDHLGTGAHGNSLARGDERGRIHPGADDNASGTAAVLAIAEALASRPAPAPVVVAFWSGEELGLLGSTAFVRQELLPAGRVAGYLNLDMVGRLRDNRLVVQGVGSSPAWPGLIERSNVPVGFDLVLQPGPFVPTDSSVFDGEEVPTLNLFTGAHPDYHRPSDTADRVDYAGLARIARFGELLVRRMAGLAEPPAFAKVERRAGPGGGRASLRAYTGTIPDYTAEAEGLALSGVVEGGPAQKAGLRGGDVIVGFGDQEIANIYDYTYALEAARIGEPIEVRYLRDGSPRETTLVPETRR